MRRLFQASAGGYTDAVWNLTIPWWEFIVRGVIVHVFLIVLLRLTGKRQVGQLAPFDLVLLLVLSNAVQNSMNGGDNSLVGGLISATTLVVLNYGVGYLAYRNKALERWIEGQPEVLIHNGRLFEHVMARAQLTHHELMAALREGGCTCVEGVHAALLENDGTISIINKHELVLAIIGGLFVIEALSVIVQVASFKLTGRRVFLMAPLHHHFEQMGWEESKIVIRFWIIAVILAIAGLATLKLR